MNAATKEENRNNKKTKWNHSPNRNGNRLNIFQCVNISPSSTVNNDWLTQKYLKMQWFLFRLVCATAAHCTDGGACRKNRPACEFMRRKDIKFKVLSVVSWLQTCEARNQRKYSTDSAFFDFLNVQLETGFQWLLPVNILNIILYFAIHAFGHCVISITQSWRRLKLDDIFNLWF